MKSDQWFIVKRKPSSTLLHFVSGGDLDEVTSYANTVYDNPVVEKLTWWIMRELTGVIIPQGREPTEDYNGLLHLPPIHGYTIMIKAL